MNFIYKYGRLLSAFVLAALLSACEDIPEIINYEGESFFRFSASASSIAENSPAPVSIPVFYTSKEGVTASGNVAFDISGGQEGVDYNIVNSDKALSISSTNGFKGEILIQPLDNSVKADHNVVLTITLKDGQNGVVGFPGPANTNSQTHTLTIIDDDCFVIPIGGTYNAVSRGTSTDGCCPDEITGFQSVITVTDNMDGTYELNDFSGGIYLEWYAVYGLTSQNQSPATFSITDPVNNTIAFAPGSGEPFGETLTGSGTYDPCTGMLNYNWQNGYGDEGTVSLSLK